MKKYALLFLSALLIPYANVIARQPTTSELPSFLQNNLSQYHIIMAQNSSDNACLSNCKEVLTLCKNLCLDAKARDRDKYGENPDKPVDECLQDCEEDYKICNQSC